MSETNNKCDCELRNRQWNPLTGRCQTCGKAFDAPEQANNETAGLRECPFCGGLAEVVFDKWLSKQFAVTCLKDGCPGVCEFQDEQGGCSSGGRTREQVIEKWNTRPHPSAGERETGRPIDIVLYCPICHKQHVDFANPDTCEDCGLSEEMHKECSGCEVCGFEGDGSCAQPFNPWLNPPHKTHRCKAEEGGCGTLFKPSDIPTNGVGDWRDCQNAPAPAAEVVERCATCKGRGTMPSAYYWDGDERFTPNGDETCRTCKGVLPLPPPDADGGMEARYAKWRLNYFTQDWDGMVTKDKLRGLVLEFADLEVARATAAIREELESAREVIKHYAKDESFAFETYDDDGGGCYHVPSHLGDKAQAWLRDHPAEKE